MLFSVRRNPLFFRAESAIPVALRNEAVVLLHGMGRHPRSMHWLKKRLHHAGYHTVSLGYPSRTQPLEILIHTLHTQLEAFLATLPPDTPIHFVTHSMGGLLTRAYLNHYRPKTLGRVVMLGPPNLGSPLADLIGNTRFYRRVFGPAGQQLLTTQSSDLLKTLGTVDYPVGIIAGDRSINLFCSLLILRQPNDGKVRVGQTHLQGQTDHIVLHTTHPTMLFSPQVLRQTLHFLAHGAFMHR